MQLYGPTILVVEDDHEVRQVIGDMLLSRGFRVRSAASASEALAIVEQQEFDLVVADIVLPGPLDGLQMAQLLRTRQPALKCLFISGYGDPIVCDPELDDFVGKPFRPVELLGCVWKVLNGNQPRPHVQVAS